MADKPHQHLYQNPDQQQSPFESSPPARPTNFSLLRHPAARPTKSAPNDFTSNRLPQTESPARLNIHEDDEVRSEAGIDDGIIDGNPYNNWETQENNGDPNHNAGHTNEVAKVRKNDDERLRKMLDRSSGNLSSIGHAPTMEALTSAIRQGLQPSEHIRRPAPVMTRVDTNLRIPFQEDPDSPSSTYTDVTASMRPQSMPLSTYQEYDLRTIEEHDVEDYDHSAVDADLPTPNSTNPILANEHPGMSSKIPATKRPPKIDIGAVRDMEARGSVTSLPDLIRRATILASNLDKGKTASRLGLLDFLGSSDKLDKFGRRDSSYSDVLDAFPTAGSPKQERPTTLWPDSQKQMMSTQTNPRAKTKSRKRRQRKCYGMSPLVFLLVLTTLAVLIAAAVLIPVFLVVLPRKQAKTNPTTCSRSHPCSNGGFSLLANNVCSCICADGFTGSDCSQAKDAACTTYTAAGLDKTFNNATIGTSVLSIFQSSQNAHNLNLNQTNLLAIFAASNLSCTSENSLVDFASTTTVKSRRYIMLPGMMSTEQPIPALNLPADESKEHKRFYIVDGIEDVLEPPEPKPHRVIHPRDNTASSNGIVFATPTNTNAATSQSVASTLTQSGGTPTMTPSAVAGVTEKQIDFAAAVVLYVLQAFQQINVAVAANQAMASYFEQTGHKNNTVEVVSGSERIDADFDKLQIVLANGTVLGSS